MKTTRITKVIQIVVAHNDDTTLDALTVGIGQHIGSQFTVGITNDPQNLGIARGQTVCGTTPTITDFVQSEWAHETTE